MDRQPFKLLESKQAQPALVIPREKVTLNESFLAVKIDSMQAPALVKSVLSVPKHQHSLTVDHQSQKAALLMGKTNLKRIDKENEIRFK